MSRDESSKQASSNPISWAAEENRRTGYRDPQIPAHPHAEDYAEYRRGLRGRLEGGPHSGKAITPPSSGDVWDSDRGFAGPEYHDRTGLSGEREQAIYVWNRRECDVHIYVFSHTRTYLIESGSW